MEPEITPFTMRDLLYLMERLRDPQTGCPWDIKQDFLSITPSTLEEAYEVVDAIETGNFKHLREELGDLLFQVIFYSQLAKEQEYFSFQDVVGEITAKLLRRHPHVFPLGTLESARSPDQSPDDLQIKASWEEMKKTERIHKGNSKLLDDVPKALPALTRAAKLQKRAARVGFDWSNIQDVIEKMREELIEFEQEAITNESATKIQEELGDILFTAVNLVRFMGFEAEQILRSANAKFERRVHYIEAEICKTGRKLENVESEEMERLWDIAKREGN